MTTIPDPSKLVRAKVERARNYVDTFGWKVFVLGRDKTPVRNCRDCHDANWTHDRERCACLFCHGFYAATDDLEQIEAMVTLVHEGWLAVRTGDASRLMVLDFEAAADSEGRTGLDTLDEFEQWTGGIELSHTLRQRTQSGGIHLLYRTAYLGPKVKSRNRVLPQMDVKGEGGYVAVPTPGRPERWWQDGRLDMASPQLLDWLHNARGRSSGGAGAGNVGTGAVSVDGYDYQRFLREGCPGGARDQFFNEAIFRMRKNGISHELASDQALRLWEMCKQPPDAEWYMPWEHVTYKLDRVWQTVAPPVMPSWRPTNNTVSEEQIIETSEENGTQVYRRGNRVVRRRTQ